MPSRDPLQLRQRDHISFFQTVSKDAQNAVSMVNSSDFGVAFPASALWPKAHIH